MCNAVRLLLASLGLFVLAAPLRADHWYMAARRSYFYSVPALTPYRNRPASARSYSRCRGPSIPPTTALVPPRYPAPRALPAPPPGRVRIHDQGTAPMSLPTQR
jgi:hypothetical protein